MSSKLHNVRTFGPGRAAQLLGLSRSRVIQLCNEGKLKCRHYEGIGRVISLIELNRFKKLERPPGRPWPKKNGT